MCSCFDVCNKNESFISYFIKRPSQGGRMHAAYASDLWCGVMIIYCSSIMAKIYVMVAKIYVMDGLCMVSTRDQVLCRIQTTFRICQCYSTHDKGFTSILVCKICHSFCSKESKVKTVLK